MRKLFFLICVFGMATLYAQTDLSGLKFCLDPGHGNYPNDKPFETRINLHVVNYLKQYLQDYGAWVITTRQDSATNISLYDRDMIANNYNVDFFLSVHHNASGSSNPNANSTLMLYQETPSGQVRWAGQSDVMCNYMADYLYRYLHTTGKSVRGDWSFYGSWTTPFNLGVLKYLSMPGVLSEASFWDFPPEVHRMNSLGYLKLEAFALVHSFLTYYTVPKKTDAYVEGVIQNLNGDKLPGITVKLANAIDTMIYVTDSQNIGITDQDRAWGGFPQIYVVKNGMYFFENFPLGQAKLIFEGSGFANDTVDVMVMARTSNQVSAITLIEDVPPKIVATSPAKGDSNFSAFQEIAIKFSRPMETTSVISAFQIVPSVNGNLSWQDQNKTLKLTPSTRFEFNQNYILQISATAKDAWNYNLDGNGDGVAGDAFSLIFRTAPMDTSLPMVVDFYPFKNEIGIFVNDLIRAEFNKLLDPASISGARILLMSETSRRIMVATDYSEWNHQGIISVLPNEMMKPNMKYYLTVANSVTDLLGNQMDAHFQWTFRTQPEELKVFPIENFETEAAVGLTPLDWKLITPSADDSLKLSSLRFAHGKQALLIDYSFSASDSLAALVDHASDTTWLKPGATVSVNILGDHSSNEIQFIFEDPDGFEASDPIAIDWTGWKSIRFDLINDPVIPWGATNPGNGKLDSAMYFAGFSIKASNTSSGQIYLDDIEQIFVPSPTAISANSVRMAQPTSFKLYPSCPNPFNPQTIIAYDVPVGKEGQVQIKIYDMNGREIHVLVDKFQKAGHYKIQWNGKDQKGMDVASGIYFCQLKVEGSIFTNKMALIR